jgi:outer membrane receptor protein involved in Fe transport
MVELPWRTNLGLSVSGREGFPLPYGHTLFDGTSLKTPLVAGGVDAQRYENIFNLDLRLAKEFQIANRAGLTLSLDAFNVTDERPVIQRDHVLSTRLNTRNVAANRILEIQSPRIFRVGARVTF